MRSTLAFVLSAVCMLLVVHGCGTSAEDVALGDSGVDSSRADTATCSAGQQVCGGSCTDTQSAHDNCGTCGSTCGAAEACVSGSCSTSCPNGQIVCGGACSTVQTDNANCGACGKACGAGLVCSNGACATTCASNLSNCSSAGGNYCANTATDNANCGACGNTCGAGKQCQAGLCQNTCGAGLNLCSPADAGADGSAPYCANFQTDNANCGSCSKKCSVGQVCSNGVCSATCANNLALCNADAGADAGAPYCANLQTDNANCSACGAACAAGQTCQSGKCTASCGAGLTVCPVDGGPGYCANVLTDTNNCNTCGNKCPNGQVCSNGSCAQLCAAPQTTCANGDGGAPYCATLSSDTNNCGSCGNVCPGSLVCINSVCTAAGSLIVSSNINLSTTNTGSRTCADGGDMVAYSVTGLTSTTATLSATPSAGCLSVGDKVLLANLQGTPGSSVNAGSAVPLTIASIAGAVVTFTTPKGNFFGDGVADDTNIGLTASNQRVTLQRMPTYASVYVAAGRTLTAAAWNGTTGGIFAINATGLVTIDGTISMKGAGYAGGPRTVTVNAMGTQGESISGKGAVVRTANSGGGGGGSGDNNNAGCRAYGVAGGGGSYSSAGFSSPDGACGGLKGNTYGAIDKTRIMLGSGGGSGGTDNTLADNPPGGFGGAGGGAVYLNAPSGVIVNGAIDVSGVDGEGDVAGLECSGAGTANCWDFSGPGGGGSGGTFVLSAGVFAGTGQLKGAGGLGGNGNNASAGDGGRGGYGRLYVPFQTCRGLGNSFPNALSGVYGLGAGGGTKYDAYCDMANNGGGWTLLSGATAAGTNYGAGTASAWNLSGVLGATPTLVDATSLATDYKSVGFSVLPTNEIALCLRDGTHCHVFAHNQNSTLQGFFTNKIYWTEYSNDIWGYSNVGTDALRVKFLSDLGINTTNNMNCYWLGINHKETDTSNVVQSFSGVGLMGDGNCGCQSYFNNGANGCGANNWIDDYAAGVGLQSCNDGNCSYDNNAHANGSSESNASLANPDGPWYVFGR